jgi:hypothetical protein
LRWSFLRLTWAPKSRPTRFSCSRNARASVKQSSVSYTNKKNFIILYFKTNNSLFFKNMISLFI